MSIQSKLERAFKQAFQRCLPSEFQDTDPFLIRSTHPQFGDWQANFAMSLSKRVGISPRQLAERVISHLDTQDLADAVSIAGPGFINLTLSPLLLSQACLELYADKRLGVSLLKTAQTIVVDYGGANVAKEMHVGHLRSTVIGDAIVRLLNFLGFSVIRQNHLGDWGTQFGMLIEWIVDNTLSPPFRDIGQLNEFYQTSKKAFDTDPAFAERARQRVVSLQQGEPETRAIWTQLVTLSEHHFEKIYDRLGVLLTPEDVRGESFYHPFIAPLLTQLEQTGLLQASEGAKVLFLEGFVDPDKKPIPFILEKSDGAYLYATTDLAALHYRLTTLKAKRIIYVTDARQKQHFDMLFAAAQKIGWVTPEITLSHVAFGSVLGKEKKPFKTRSGETIRLSALLEEAKERALNVISEKRVEASPEEKDFIAENIAISALKYADLCSDKIKDYVFDWDHMLAFEGNTAPYLLNAYVRIQAIFRKKGGKFSGKAVDQWIFEHSSERALLIQLAQFSETLQSVAQDFGLHRLCHYLHTVASYYHHFYEHCPILNHENEALRNSRLMLSQLTARTLKLGLSLLGITVLDRM